MTKTVNNIIITNGITPLAISDILAFPIACTAVVTKLILSFNS